MLNGIDYVKMVRTLASTNYEQCASNFHEKPHPDNWNKLLEAMMFHQCVQSVNAAHEHKFADRVIADWPEIACMIIHEQTIEDALKSA